MKIHEQIERQRSVDIRGLRKLLTHDALEEQFGSLSDETVHDGLEKKEQVNVALLVLAESGSIDVVLGSSSIRSRGIATFGPSLRFL